MNPTLSLSDPGASSGGFFSRVTGDLDAVVTSIENGASNVATFLGSPIQTTTSALGSGVQNILSGLTPSLVIITIMGVVALLILERLPKP